MRITLLSCLSGLMPVTTPPVHAQQEAVDAIDEIVVTGTRRLNRTAANSPVPVDVFQGEELENMGTGDMDEG